MMQMEELKRMVSQMHMDDGFIQKMTLCIII